jgi:hypothetical protein
MMPNGPVQPMSLGKCQGYEHIMPILHNLHIYCIYKIHVAYSCRTGFSFSYFMLCRRQVLKERASKFIRSACDSFAFATSLPIETWNRIIQAVTNDGFNPMDTLYITNNVPGSSRISKLCFQTSREKSLQLTCTVKVIYRSTWFMFNAHYMFIDIFCILHIFRIFQNWVATRMCSLFRFIQHCARRE